jgi:transcriptional regulator with XRE-family HTH domain
VKKPGDPRLVYRDIAARMRAARIAAGLTQEEAAARAAIAYKRWQDIEAGRANTTILTLNRVAAALGVDFWAIVRPSVKHVRPR